MNAKTSLLIAVALVVHASAHAATFATNATINAGDTTYDGQHVAVTNCTLTINGSHAFSSLALSSNAVLTHAAAPRGEADNRLDLAIAGDVTVDATSSINTSGRGYISQEGPGRGNWSSWGGGGGGGHGGNGGNANPGDGAGAIYGSINSPSTHGSGGARAGGEGGGAIRLQVGGTLLVDGDISANGYSGYQTGYSGAGAGGSVNISAATISGRGIIRANGGNALDGGTGGGGGGRVALMADAFTFSGSLSAIGGTGFQAGGAGTIFTRVSTESRGRLLVDNAGRAGYTRFGSTNWSGNPLFALTVAGSARLALLTPISVSELDINTAAMLTHDRLGQPLRVNVLGSALISSGASINVDGAGYFGSTPGPGFGSVWNINGCYGGAGHGGVGGPNDAQRGQGATYGSAEEPLEFGSVSQQAVGSGGGGSVRLVVGGTLTVDGSITANGQGSSAAGGSIFIICEKLAGGGDVLARGSAASNGCSGGGGGGRLAVHTGTLAFTGTRSVTGGEGGVAGGSPGTIHDASNAALCGFVRSASQEGVAGARITASTGQSTLSDASGGFVLVLPSGWTGSVSAAASGLLVTPSSRALENILAPQFGIDFVAQPLPPPPVITSAPIASGRVGEPFEYQISATGSPEIFGAAGLPAALSVNTTNGLISGTPEAAGNFSIEISAGNQAGTNIAALALTIDPMQSVVRTNVLQPGPGLNDGTDDGSATRGKDASRVFSGNGTTSAFLLLYNSTCNVGRWPACIQFSTFEMPSNLVTSATVEIHCKMVAQLSTAWPAKAYPISVRRVTSSWDELSLPATVDPTPLASNIINAVGGTGGFVEFEGWLSFDITSTYSNWVLGSEMNYGLEFAIDETYCANGNDFFIASSDSADPALRPKLVVRSGPARPTLNVAAEGATLRLSWDAEREVAYQLEQSGTLTNWSPLGEPVIGQGGAASVAVPTTNSPTFLRLRVR